jgi:hypothetical protein
VYYFSFSFEEIVEIHMLHEEKGSRVITTIYSFFFFLYTPHNLHCVKIHLVLTHFWYRLRIIRLPACSHHRTEYIYFMMYVFNLHRHKFHVSAQNRYHDFSYFV